MADRVNQDIEIVIREVTSSKARADQDFEFAIRQPTGSHARVNQDFLLALRQPQPSHPIVRVNQDVLLVIRKKPLPVPPVPPPIPRAPQRSPLVDPYIEALDPWFAAIENLTAEGDCNSINIPWLLSLSVTQGNAYTVAIAQHRWTFEPEWGFDITGAGKGSMYGSGGQGTGQGGPYVSW